MEVISKDSGTMMSQMVMESTKIQRINVITRENGKMVKRKV
jgi:hypothetical protein